MATMKKRKNIFSFFNHKGGVGKTTLVHNVGSALAAIGKKVLLIDADSQMNLTASFHGLSDSVEYTLGGENEKGEQPESITSKWNNIIGEHLSIYDVINNALLGDESKQKILQKKEYNKGTLSMLNGSIKLANLEIDVNLALATQRSIQEAQILRMQETLFSLAENYDAVFIDTPPSAGSAITSLLVQSSDYLITPVSPTFFSLQAIDNLKDIFINWNKELQWLSTFKREVKFMGCVVQMGKRHTGGSNKSDFSETTTEWTKVLNERMKPFQKWMKSTENSISEEDFVQIFGDKNKPFIIEICCDFTPQLRTIAEKAGVPIIELTPTHCAQYKPKGSTVDIIKEDGQYTISFRKINEQYRGIASNIANIL